MAKHITSAFNVNAFLDAAIQVVNKGGDAPKATKAAAALIKGRTLSECVDAFCVGADLKRGISASQQAAANEARAVLMKDGVDIMKTKAVLDALRPIFWAKRGYAEPLKQSNETPLQGKQALDYQNASADISRMGKLVMNKAPQRVAADPTPVPRALYSVLLAQKNDGFTKEQMLAAIAKLFPKAAK